VKICGLEKRGGSRCKDNKEKYGTLETYAFAIEEFDYVSRRGTFRVELTKPQGTDKGSSQGRGGTEKLWI